MCRNPSSTSKGAWCYVAEDTYDSDGDRVRWDYCYKNNDQHCGDIFPADQKGWKGRNCMLSAVANDDLDLIKYLNSNYPELKDGRDNNNQGICDLADWNTSRFLADELKIYC